MQQPERVILKPQDPRVYAEGSATLEPQYITSVEPTEAWIWISSQDCSGNDKTRCNFHSTQALGVSVRRITVKGFATCWDTPNVNARNQNVRFFSSVSGVFHSVNIPAGYYGTALSLSNALIAALNTETGASSLTFSTAVIANNPAAYTLNAVGGLFYFDPTCTGVAKGRQLWNLPGDITPSASKRIGTMFLMYTQYVDVISGAITKNSKMRSITSNYTSRVAVRAYVGGSQPPGEVSFYSPPVDLHFAHRADEPIYDIDIMLLDQNGDMLYVSDPEKFMWNLTLGFEG
jgi:hypothetical protein